MGKSTLVLGTSLKPDRYSNIAVKRLRANNIEVREVNFSLFDVYGADEAFVTGTFAGIIPVSKIEDRILKSTSSDSLVNQIRFLYNKHIKENIN